MSDADNSTAAPAPTQSSSDGSAFSLLSLSIAAANAAPIPVADPSALPSVNGVLGLNGSHAGPSGPPLSASVGSGVKQHRRLASTGKARRRLSDARDAATRPSPAALQTTAAALSLASLSLSSPPPQAQGTPASIPFSAAASTTLSSPMAIPNPAAHPVSGNGTSSSAPHDDGSSTPAPPLTNGTNGNTPNPIAINGVRSGKKRGTDHKCESCSKIYRHPSCLIKHRWEHTPHWREASKFVLSKHQQVQLLEAAAILSHLSPSSTGTSLPEDRSLWPSFLSGGSLPPPSAADGVAIANGTGTGSAIPVSSSPYAAHPTSSSVPASAVLGGSNRATSAGPRLHDYSIPASAGGAAGVTLLRPGLLGVPTGPGIIGSTSVSASTTLPVPVPNANPNGAFGTYHTKVSHSWGSPYASVNGNVSSYNSNSAAISSPLSQSYGQRSTGEGGWSLPRSSVRSVSVSSQSRSRSGSASGSRSDDESVDVDVEVDVDLDGGRYRFSSRGRAWKTEEEDESSFGFSVREQDEYEDGEVGLGGKGKASDWDGMEMEMDMDMD